MVTMLIVGSAQQLHHIPDKMTMIKYINTSTIIRNTLKHIKVPLLQLLEKERRRYYQLLCQTNGSTVSAT